MPPHGNERDLSMPIPSSPLRTSPLTTTVLLSSPTPEDHPTEAPTLPILKSGGDVGDFPMLELEDQPVTLCVDEEMVVEAKLPSPVNYAGQRRRGRGRGTIYHRIRARSPPSPPPPSSRSSRSEEDSMSDVTLSPATDQCHNSDVLPTALNSDGSGSSSPSCPSECAGTPEISSDWNSPEKRSADEMESDPSDPSTPEEEKPPEDGHDATPPPEPRRSSLKKPTVRHLGSCSSPVLFTKHVSFTNLHIREYGQVLGDHPCCSSGPPVSLGWNFSPATSVKLDDYEQKRDPRKTRKEMRMTIELRREILLSQPSSSSNCGGYTQGDFRKVERKLHRERVQRGLNGFFFPPAQSQEEKGADRANEPE